MGWLFGRRTPNHRLLDARTAVGGVVFWVKDEADARDRDYVSRLLSAEMKQLPTGFVALLATARPGQALPIDVRKSRDGGWEVHIDPPSAGGDDGLPQECRDPSRAAARLCEVASSLLPALSDDAIGRHFATVQASMNLRLTRAARATIEPMVSRALALTESMMLAQLGAGARCKGSTIDTAEAKQAASILTTFVTPDNQELALPLLAWRGDDGRLYVGIHETIADIVVSGNPPGR